ncbi:MAG TPA: hypothetical protein VF411_00740 [Bacteroidia bacterium]
MKKTFILLVGMISLSAFAQKETSKTKELPKVKAAYYVNVNMDFVFKDKDGRDLLDSANGNHYSAKDITLYYLEKGKMVKIDKPRMDYPNNQFIYRDTESNIFHLRVFLEREIVLVQLNATIIDTIKCTIKKEKGSTQIEKVWYNGILKWELGKDKSQVITIIKQQ